MSSTRVRAQPELPRRVERTEREARVDGIVGPALRSSLRRFQTSRSLAVTGTITPEALDAPMLSRN